MKPRHTQCFHLRLNSHKHSPQIAITILIFNIYSTSIHTNLIQTRLWWEFSPSVHSGYVDQLTREYGVLMRDKREQPRNRSYASLTISLCVYILLTRNFRSSLCGLVIVYFSMPNHLPCNFLPHLLVKSVHPVPIPSFSFWRKFSSFFVALCSFFLFFFHPLPICFQLLWPCCV